MPSFKSFLKLLAFWKRNRRGSKSRQEVTSTPPIPASVAQAFVWACKMPAWPTTAEPSDVAKYVRSQLEQVLEDTPWWICYSAEKDKAIIYLSSTHINRILTVLMANAPATLDKSFVEHIRHMRAVTYINGGFHAKRFADDLQISRSQGTLSIRFGPTERVPRLVGHPTESSTSSPGESSASSRLASDMGRLRSSS